MVGVKKCVIASLGFDVDFILRRFRGDNVKRLVCFGVKVDAQSWSRVEGAFSLIKRYCEALGVYCSLEVVSLEALVPGIGGVIERELRNGVCDRVELFLTGGPRVLVVGGLLAALSLHDSLAQRVDVRVEGEGFNALLEFNVGSLIRYLMLDEDSRKVLEAALEPSRASDIVRKITLSRSKVYRRVRNLVATGILKEVEDKVYVAEEDTRGLIRIIKREHLGVSSTSRENIRG